VLVGLLRNLAARTIRFCYSFFHQTLMTMADSFQRATGENEMCEDMRDFCRYFAERMQIMHPGDQ